MRMINDKKLISLRLNQNLYAEIQRRAKKEVLSVNSFIEQILMKKLGFQESNEEKSVVEKDLHAISK